MSVPVMELERRSFVVRGTDPDAGERTFTGVAVPFDTEVELWPGWRESVAPGAVEPYEGGVKVFDAHREVIGRVTGYRDTEAGWEITGAISDTTRGRDVYAMLRDQTLDRLSIGFEPVEHVETTNEDGSVTIRRTRVRVFEVSVVAFPAYPDATVTDVRAKTGPTATEERTAPMAITEADLTEVRESIELLGRRLDVAGTQTPAETGPQFRSFGDYVKRVAAGDELALRAYTGAVSGDAVVKDAWIGNLVDIIHKPQTVASTFATGSLPPEGLGVEYAVLKTDTTQVGVQASEGADLLFGKVAITTNRADVKTLGGWSSLSRQAIERANVSILDTMFTALAERYGQAVEVLTRGVLTTALAATGPAALASITADLATQNGVVKAVLDLVEAFETAGRNLDGIFVDKATFLALYAVTATDRVLQINGAAADKVGTLTVQSGEGNVAGLPFRLLPNAAADTVVAYDKTAIKTLESPGAPLRLQDENIVNLSKDFSVYGYAAAFVQQPAGLVKLVKA